MMSPHRVRACRLCGSTVDGYRPYDCAWLEWNLCDGCLWGLDALGLREVQAIPVAHLVDQLPDFAALSPFQPMGNHRTSSA